MTPKTPTVLVVDDEPDLLSLIDLTLTKLGLNVVCAGSVREAREILSAKTFDMCLTDMKLQDGTGLDVLAEIAKLGFDLPTAVITAFGNADNAVAALKAGAFDYLAKPVSLDQLRALVKNALSIPPKSATAPRQTLAEPNATNKRTLLGTAPAIVKLRDLLNKLALSMAPIHIHGESGTGKELAARILHEAGPRASGPFIAVNCGAIPENLMESEFFGAKKGSFTGANEDRIGFFQAANRGTLFLDEVADLPLAMQVKLLRAIQERAVRRVGSSNEEPVDIRLVSATHKRLNDLVASGAFRQDLFYRLSVIPVTMPSLREIRDDVGQIANSVLARLSKGTAKLTPDAEAALARYDFPGNVRELENILERAIALATSPGQISADDLHLTPSSDEAFAPPLSPEPDEASAGSAAASPSDCAAGIGAGVELQAYLDDVEKRALLEALARAHGNRTQAARLLGITFRSMRYRLERLGLDAD